MFANSYEGATAGSVMTLNHTFPMNINMSVGITKAAISQSSGNRVYVIKLVNYANVAYNVSVQLQNYPSSGKLSANADLYIMASKTANIAEENTFEEPMAVAPVKSSLAISGPTFTVNAAAYSINVLRVYSQE